MVARNARAWTSADRRWQRYQLPRDLTITHRYNRMNRATRTDVSGTWRGELVERSIRWSLRLGALRPPDYG